MGENSIYTKVKDEVPVQYKDTAVVKNSLIANGCIIRGEVENSILFRGVTIEKGVKVKNSIIMQKCDVQENSLLENVICEQLGIHPQDILDFDLYLYDTTPACTFGIHDEFVSAGRLDDLSMVHAGLQALLQQDDSDAP